MLNKPIDFIKTVFIYILTVLMLVSAGYYINARQNSGKIYDIPLEKRRIFEGNIVFTEIDETHFNPVQITLTFGGESKTTVYDDVLTDGIYEYDFIKSAVSGLFNNSADCVVYDHSEGSELWQKAAGMENSVYIRYAGDYIYPVIYTFLDSRNYDNINRDKPLAEVMELFIVDLDPIFGVSRDSEGNVAAFIPSGDNRGREYISREINSFLQMVFNNIEREVPGKILSSDINNLYLPDSFYFLGDNPVIYSPVLIFENPLLDSSGNMDLNQNFIKNLFRLLNFNYERAHYSSSITSAVYTDGFNSVIFNENGQINYRHRAVDIGTSGLHLSRFLGYDSDYYNFFDKLKAASAFANILLKDFVDLTGGFESRLLLKDIFYENNDLNVVFAYYHRGIEIRIRHGALVLKINKTGISEVTINALKVSRHSIIKNIDPMLILREIDRLISEDIIGFELTEEFIGGLEEKYNLQYNKNKGKFFVSQFELIYNVDYFGGICEPVWVIG